MEEEYNIEDVELAKQVEAYQRRTESGAVIQVRGYVRTSNSAVADRARQAPGRPSVAATAGRFPGDRSIPVWPDAGKGVTGPQTAEEPEGPPEYEDLPDTGEVDQDTLDSEVPVALEIMSNLPQNPALRRLMGILRSLSSASLSDVEGGDTVELARRTGTVRVKGYSYVNKQGKVVVVNPYSQLRKLLIAMGGPTMAANRGITPDLVDSAFPGYEMKDKLYKTKETKRGVSRFAADTSANRRRAQDALVKINREVKIDREFDVPKPKPGEDYMAKAMLPTNPLESVRNAQEGSQVFLEGKAWVRSGEGKWYTVPRRNAKGKTDKQITKEIASRGGTVQLHQAQPIERTAYRRSEVDVSRVASNAADAPAARRYAQALNPTIENVPQGLADSINGHIQVRSSRGARENVTNMVRTETTSRNKHYPKLQINPNPEFEKDLIDTIPKQQQQGYMVPTTLHPMETVMARESATFIESVMQNRAPSEMTDRMYDRLNDVYDKYIKADSKSNYAGLAGREGWMARLTGERSDELRSDIRENLSLSALNSPEDFLAEAWTEFVGNPEPRPLARDMGYAFQNSMDEFSNYLRQNKWVDASDIPDNVWQNSTAKTESRSISDAIGGATDRTVETNLAPRDLRSVLSHSAKYVDIRDEDGNPLFDAELVREGDTAYIGTVSLPEVDPSTMPSGAVDFLPITVTEETAKYFRTPMDRIDAAQNNPNKYARFVHQDRALRALEAVEESLFSQGVRRMESDIAPDESVLYARAGYTFDPNATDHVEITNMLKGIKERLDGMKEDYKAGFYEIPKSVQNSSRRKVNKWLKDINEDPETWPTPKQIAELGKLNILEQGMGEQTVENMRLNERTLGEITLRETSWSGVKLLDGKGYPTDVPSVNDPELPDVPYVEPPSPKDVVKEAQPKAPIVNNAARAINPPPEMPEAGSPSNVQKAMTKLAEESLAKHRSYMPNAEVKVRGTRERHFISVSDEGENLANIEVRVSGDSVYVSENASSANRASAILTSDLMDDLDTSYQNSGLQFLRRQTREGDPAGNYTMAAMGHDWDNPPTREELSTNLYQQLDKQAAAAEMVMRQAVADQLAKLPESDTGAQFRMEQRVESEVQELRASLTSQIEALLQIYDVDPKGPTPFELSMLGKREAARIETARRYLENPEYFDETLDPWGVKSPQERAQLMAKVYGGRVPDPEDLPATVQQPRFNQNAPTPQSATVQQPVFNQNAPTPQSATVQQPVLNQNAPTPQSATATVQQPVFNQNAPSGVQHHPNIPVNLLPPLPNTLTPQSIAAYNKQLDQLEKDLEFQKRREGTLLQQMTSLDGDALHDSFGEFLGKQALTMGAYGWYKSLGGWWNWATDTYKPTARKATVNLLFMMLRLLPSGVTRGALLGVTSALVKRVKSPRPDEWPSPQEIDDVVQQIAAKLPQSTVQQLFGGNGP